MKYNRVLYISITRTGSNSIRDWFIKNYPTNYYSFGYTPKNDPPSRGNNGLNFQPLLDLNKFRLIDFVGGHYFIDSQKLYNCIAINEKDFEFTCVRNPLEKLVSGYFFSLKYKPVGKDLEITKHDFKTFIMKREEIIKTLNQQQICHTYKLQTEFQIQNCKVFLKTESLTENWKSFCIDIGLDYSKIDHVNGSSHDHFMNYWDQEMLEFCYEWLKPDFEFLGYEYPNLSGGK